MDWDLVQFLPIQFALLTTSCLSFSLDPKIQNISLFHQTFVYGWISMAIASSHQIPHHHRWCLLLWHSPHLTLSFSLSFGFLCFLLLSSPAMAKLLLPPTPIVVGSASHRRHNHWWPWVQLFYSLFSFSFTFFNFYLPFIHDWNPFDTHFVLFLISLMNGILFQFWLAWWMGFLVWISSIINNYYY